MGTSSGPALGGQRAQMARVAGAEDVGEVDARRVHAGLLEQRVQPRRVRALGQPEAAAPAVAEARAVRLDARCAPAGARRRRWPAAAGPRASPALVHAANGAQRAEQVGGQALERERVLAGRALELGRHGARPRPPRCRARATAGRTSRRKARQRSSAPGASSWSHSTGVSESVTGAPASQHVEQRQVGGRDRLPQPLLAERPRPEALDVGQMRVQDDGQAALAHGCSTATKSSARSRSRSARRAKSRVEIAGTKRS